MKKNEVKNLKKFKKLKLSRETLRELTDSDVQKAEGGVEPSCQSAGACVSDCDTIGNT